MSLAIWLPLTEDFGNQGLQYTTFSKPSGADAAINASGKIGKCHTSTSGGIISSKTINTGVNISMFAWIKPSSTPSYQGICGQYRGNPTGTTASSTSTGACLGLSGYAIKAVLNGSVVTSSNVISNLNIWYHVGFTYSAATKTVTLYFNGAAVKDASINGYTATNDFVVAFNGAFSGGAGSTTLYSSPFKGALNDVRIYDHCCSAKEVKEMSLGIVLHYKFDDEVIMRSTMYDCSGYRNNGTITGTLTSSTDAGRYSRSLLFPNTTVNSNYIAVNTAGNFCPALTGCTIAWWGKPNSVKSLLLTGQSGSYYVAASSSTMYNENAGSPITYYVDGVRQNSAPSYIAGSWHHYVLTNVNLSAWTQMHINRYSTTSTEWCVNGYLNDLRIYSTVLSEADVKSLYSTVAAVDDKGAFHTFEFKEV